MAPPFLDNLLAPFRRPRVRPTETIGAPGTAIYGGFIQEGERNSRLTGTERYRTFSDILANTSIVAAGTRYFLNLVAGAGWSFEPADHPEGERLAELAEEYITRDPRTSWHRIVRRAAMYRFYGFSTQEWTARRREDGGITLADVAPRAQFTIERWDTDVEGTVRGVVQRAPQSQREIYIPREKIVYVVDDTLSDSPEGLGLFRHLVEPVERLRRYEQLEGFGFEGDLRGIPVGRGPFEELRRMEADGQIDRPQRMQIEAPLRDFIKNHIKSPKLGLILDSITYQNTDDAQRPSAERKWDIDLLKAPAGTQEEVARAIERINREIARTLGVEGLLLGGEKVGSQALSRDKTHNFFLIVDSTLKELRESFQDDLLTTIWQLNGWPQEAMPEMRTEAVRFKDIEQITTALRDMATAGAVLMPEDPAVAEVYRLLGLTPPPDDRGDDADAALTAEREAEGTPEEEGDMPEDETQEGRDE